MLARATQGQMQRPSASLYGALHTILVYAFIAAQLRGDSKRLRPSRGVEWGGVEWVGVIGEMDRGK